MVSGVREWELVAEEKEIEVAPGVKYPAWAYNGRVPGPTLRAREGERLRIRFTNGSKHPHTIHFHGIHPRRMDGVPGLGPGNIEPGQVATYEFDAKPFGLHLYHCHSTCRWPSTSPRGSTARSSSTRRTTARRPTSW